MLLHLKKIIKANERYVLTTSKTTKVNNSGKLTTLNRFDFDVVYDEGK